MLDRGRREVGVARQRREAQTHGAIHRARRHVGLLRGEQAHLEIEQILFVQVTRMIEGVLDREIRDRVERPIGTTQRVAGDREPEQEGEARRGQPETSKDRTHRVREDSRIRLR